MSSFIENLYMDPSRAKEQFVETALGALKIAGTAMTIVNPPLTPLAVVGTGLKSKALDAIEAYAIHGATPYYGSWGGGLYSGNRIFKPDESITRKDIEVGSKDIADELFKLHDLRYQKAMTLGEPKERENGLRQADQFYLDEASQLMQRPDVSLTQKLATAGAMALFKGKLFTGLGYSYPQISDPEASRVVDEYFAKMGVEQFLPEKRQEVMKKLEKKLEHLNRAQIKKDSLAYIERQAPFLIQGSMYKAPEFQDEIDNPDF